MAKRQWLKLDRQVCRNLKIRKLANRLRVKPSVVVGHMVSLWCSAFDREETEWGNLGSLGAEGIALNAEWDGDPNVFLDALVDVQLLDRVSSPDVTRNFDVTIHDWEEFAGPYLLNREKSRVRMQNMRDRKAPKKRPKTQNNAKEKELRVTLSNVGQTPLRSNTASGSDAVSSSNQTQATAARAVSDEKPLQPFAPQKKSSLPSSAASRADQTPTSPPNTTLLCSERPMPSTQSCQANQSDIQAPPASTARAAAISQSPARLLMQQNPSAPAVTPPFAEIVEKPGLSVDVIQDALRNGSYGQIIAMNHHGRRRLREIANEYTVTRDMLDQAFARAIEWHRHQNGALNGRVEVTGTTIAKCLQTVCHEHKETLDLHSNLVGVARGERLASEAGDTPLNRLGGGLTRQEAAKVRSDAKMMEFALRKEREDKEAEARLKLKAATKEEH